MPKYEVIKKMTETFTILVNEDDIETVQEKMICGEYEREFVNYPLHVDCRETYEIREVD